MTRAKPFVIQKRDVWEAFKRVKANHGAAGVDGQSIEAFEAKLSANLYKLWNRMSSGSYMPPPVRRVDIPKAGGGTRPLGIPTVADRIAQEVVRRYLEPILEPVFHADSYGYRPGRSAIDAIRTARERCWRSDWVLDIDIKGFFDNIDHALLLKAIRRHTDCVWAVLYIERWLKAPAMLDDGELVARDRGTPQGGVISPLLANLFLHYAFDVWLGRAMPGCRSSGMPTTSSVIAALSDRQRRYGHVWMSGSARVVSRSTRRRRSLSTARTRTARASTRASASTSLAIHSGLGWRSGAGDSTEFRFCPAQALVRSKRFAGQSVTGASRGAATRG